MTWTLDEVRGKLADAMTRAFDAVWTVAEAERLSLRSAAYAVAFRRLGAALDAQGTRAYFRGDAAL